MTLLSTLPTTLLSTLPTTLSATLSTTLPTPLPTPTLSTRLQREVGAQPWCNVTRRSMKLPSRRFMT